MELVTTALEHVMLFSWWWLAIPVGIGLVLFVIGMALNDSTPMGLGAAIVLLGTFFLSIANVSGSTYNEDLLRSDVAEQLRIEDTVKDGDWYTGRGPDGEFVRFALVEKDGAENTYAVLVEKQ